MYWGIFHLDSFQIFVESNQGDEEITRIDVLDIFGVPVEYVSTSYQILRHIYINNALYKIDRSLDTRTKAYIVIITLSYSQDVLGIGIDKTRDVPSCRA